MKQHPQRQKRLVIWAAKGMFKSARKLAVALMPDTPRHVLIVRSDSLRFKPRDTDITINWGNSKPADWLFNQYKVEPINNEFYVHNSVNKLSTFEMLEGHCNIPEWTTDTDLAADWVAQKKEVLGRKVLTGFGGEGIEFYDPNAGKTYPLYVQYKKKKKEFRVHVFKGEVIDITQKKKRKDFDGEVNTKIRNYANGWVYCREDIVEPDDLREQALLAMDVLGLDFGAIDIIWNEKENKSYVLEINTAPGLEGTTIEAYKNAILKEIN